MKKNQSNVAIFVEQRTLLNRDFNAIDSDSRIDMYSKNVGTQIDLVSVLKITAKTGHRKNLNEIFSAFSKKDLCMSFEVTGILFNYSFFLTKDESETIFAFFKVGDILKNKKGSGTYRQILEKVIGKEIQLNGKTFAIKFCLPQDATDLRENQKLNDQPPLEVLHLATENISDSRGNSRIFSLVRLSNKLHLKATPTSVRLKTAYLHKDKWISRKEIHFFKNEVIGFRLEEIKI